MDNTRLLGVESLSKKFHPLEANLVECKACFTDPANIEKSPLTAENKTAIPVLGTTVCRSG